MILFGPRVFADVVNLMISRCISTDLEWALDPMTAVHIQSNMQRQIHRDTQREKDHVRMETRSSTSDLFHLGQTGHLKHVLLAMVDVPGFKLKHEDPWKAFKWSSDFPTSFYCPKHTYSTPSVRVTLKSMGKDRNTRRFVDPGQ